MIVTAILQLIGIGVIIFGWSVIQKSSRKIASRNEDHALCNRLFTELKAIEESAHSFWLGNTGIDPETWVTLCMPKIQNIRAVSIELQSRKFSQISPAQIINLRKSLTLDADNKGFRDKGIIRTRIREITMACLGIRATVWNELKQRHPPET